MCACQTARRPLTIWAKPEIAAFLVGLLTGLSLGEVFLAFEAVRGMVFRPTEPPAAALFIALALVAAVKDCVVR